MHTPSIPAHTQSTRSSHPIDFIHIIHLLVHHPCMRNRAAKTVTPPPPPIILSQDDDPAADITNVVTLDPNCAAKSQTGLKRSRFLASIVPPGR
jgi:hypothetical protein